MPLAPLAAPAGPAVRRWRVLACLALVLLALRPARADTVLTVYAQAYTPEITTGDNPLPLHQFTRLARKFESVHPGVTVQFLKNPVGDYRTWMRTQLQGGMAPDIMWAHTVWANEDAKYGWFVNLDPYLDQPNPYVKAGLRGARRWGDEFYPDATNVKRAPDGHLYSLPIDLVETAIFYNKDLFAKAGVQPPRTWAEFIRIQQRLQQSGTIPFLMTGAQDMRLSWARAILLDQLWDDKVAQMDIGGRVGVGYPGVEPQEFVSAYKRGVFSVRDPRYREALRLLKQWSQYFQKGYLAAQDDRLFRLGRAAMWWDGSWYTPQIDGDPLRKFRYGLFLVPPLTRESSPYAPLHPSPLARGVGGASSIQYAITNSAVAHKNIDLAVDFLRFITAPQNLDPLVSEAQKFIPNVVGLKGSPLLEPYLRLLKVGHVRFEGEEAGARYSDQQYRLLQGYLGGRYTEDEVVARLDRYLAPGVAQLIRDNSATWRFAADGTVAPAPPDAAPIASKPGPPWSALGLAAALLIGIPAAFFAHPRTRGHRGSYAFILPTFLLLALFSYYPIASAFWHCLTEWRGNGDTTWVGLANFGELFRDDIMGEASWNAIRLMGAQILISLTVPLLVAELIFALRSGRAQYLYRVLFIVPMVVPGVVILLIWGFIYDDNLGLLNQTLAALGLGHLQQSWLGDPALALNSLIFVGFPWVGGFALLIYYAGLQNVPTDVFDSARIDGATGLARFRHVDLPLLMGQVKLLVVLGFIGGLQGFQTQLLLNNGGPAYATTVPGLQLYQNAISFDRMGYACAIGVALFIVILGVTYLNMRYLRSSTEYQA